MVEGEGVVGDDAGARLPRCVPGVRRPRGHGHENQCPGGSPPSPFPYSKLLATITQGGEGADAEPEPQDDEEVRSRTAQCRGDGDRDAHRGHLRESRGLPLRTNGDDGERWCHEEQEQQAPSRREHQRGVEPRSLSEREEVVHAVEDVAPEHREETCEDTTRSSAPSDWRTYGVR